MRWSRVPDVVIGTAVLLMAIAMPVYYFDRAAQLHSSGSTLSAHQAADRQSEPGITIGKAARLFMPLSGAFVTPRLPSPRAHAKAKRRPSTAGSNKTSPSASPSPAATAQLRLAAIAKVTPSSGSAPLTVTVDASGSTNAPQVPIVNVLIDCGTGSGASEVSKPWITRCSYTNPGTYTVTVLVYDLDTRSSSASATVTVKALTPSPSP